MGKAAANEALWNKFEGQKGTVTMSDIPFPDIGALLTLQARDKENLKRMVLRWHPDKFQQNFGSRLCKAQEDRIMARVKETFQAINSARQGGASFTYMQTG